jgi:hypothetical protein
MRSYGVTERIEGDILLSHLKVLIFVKVLYLQHRTVLTYFNNQLNAQFHYSLTIRMLHYNPRHVSGISMPIFRRTNCIIAASDIDTLRKRLYSMPDESRLSSGILYSRLQRVMIPDVVII